MKRAGLGMLLLVCATAGTLLAVVVARPSSAGTLQTTGSTTSATDTTATTTTATTATTTTTTVPTTTATVPTTTTAPKPKPPPPKPSPKPRTIAPGVRVAGIAVGGLTRPAALAAVRAAFAKPLVLVFERHRLQPSPAALGAAALAKQAVNRAASARPRSAVVLPVRVRGAVVRDYVARLAERWDREPVDARLYLRELKPFVTQDVTGRTFDRARATQAIVAALAHNSRRPVRLVAKTVAPEVTRADFGSVVVIRRSSNRLELYDGMKPVRTFGVATGQARYPTPLGRFEIVVMWQNPWWYPPDSDWAQGQEPVPPGPGNPLGTRWMGISSPGVGIHGTPDGGSIGYSVSHGCIRMQISQAEWLFEHVSVGTPVFIVPA